MSFQGAVVIQFERYEFLLTNFEKSKYWTKATKKKVNLSKSQYLNIPSIEIERKCKK